MKRVRVKAVGLGLALFAGPLVAADGPLPAGNSAPALLPTSVRGAGSWSSVSEAPTIWLPVRKPAPPPQAVAPVVPSAAAGQVMTWVKPALEVAEPHLTAAGPRLMSNLTAAPLPDLPAIPPIPGEVPATPAPPVQPTPHAAGVGEWRTVAQQPLAAPRIEVVPPAANPPANAATSPDANAVPGVMPARPPMVVPTPLAPSVVPPVPTMPPEPTEPTAEPETPPTPKVELPTPRPVPSSDAPPSNAPPTTAPGAIHEGELPVAPPELMLPAGAVAPGKHGTFGSAPIQLSKDYAPFQDWFHRDGEEGQLGKWLFGDGSAAKATDRLYLRTEYLLWWVNPQRVPVLGTTSTNGGLGFLGDPGTQTLVGPGSFGRGLRSGMRMRAGWWADDCGTWGVDSSFFFLGRQGNTATFNSGTYPTITRPFFAPNFNSEFGEIVALPGFSAGALTVNTNSTLWGFDANLRHALCNTCVFRAEVFGGYRALGLAESLTVTEFITALPGNPNDPPGTRVNVQDRFGTRNRFNGGQLGMAAERNWGNFSIDGRASVGLGDTHQTLDISGTQIRLRPGMTTPDVFNGGLLATGPNLGRFTRDRFSVVPEVSLNAGYWLTPTIKAYVGYNFLYWSNVIRPGDQIDRVIDVTLVPNPPTGAASSGVNRPQPQFHQSDLWVNGITFGLMGRW